MERLSFLQLFDRSVFEQLRADFDSLQIAAAKRRAEGVQSDAETQDRGSGGGLTLQQFTCLCLFRLRLIDAKMQPVLELERLSRVADCVLCFFSAADRQERGLVTWGDCLDLLLQTESHRVGGRPQQEAAGADQTVGVWPASSDKPRFTSEGAAVDPLKHEGGVRAVYCMQTRNVVLCCDTKTPGVRVLGVSPEAPVYELRRLAVPPDLPEGTCLAVSMDEVRSVVGAVTADHVMVFWDCSLGFTETCRPLIHFPIPRPASSCHQSSLWFVRWSLDPSSGYFLSSGTDCAINLWNPWLLLGQNKKQSALVASLAGHLDLVTGAIGCLGTDILATCSCDSTVKLWHVKSLIQCDILRHHTLALRCVSYDPSRHLLFTAGHESHACAFSLSASGDKFVGKLSGHRASLVGLVVVPQSCAVVTLDESGYARVWDISSIGVHGAGSASYQVIPPSRVPTLKATSLSMLGSDSIALAAPERLTFLKRRALPHTQSEESQKPKSVVGVEIHFLAREIVVATTVSLDVYDAITSEWQRSLDIPYDAGTVSFFRLDPSSHRGFLLGTSGGRGAIGDYYSGLIYRRLEKHSNAECKVVFVARAPLAGGEDFIVVSVGHNGSILFHPSNNSRPFPLDLGVGALLAAESVRNMKGIVCCTESALVLVQPASRMVVGKVDVAADSLSPPLTAVTPGGVCVANDGVVCLASAQGHIQLWHVDGEARSLKHLPRRRRAVGLAGRLKTPAVGRRGTRRSFLGPNGEEADGRSSTCLSPSAATPANPFSLKKSLDSPSVKKCIFAAESLTDGKKTDSESHRKIDTSRTMGNLSVSKLSVTPQKIHKAFTRPTIALNTDTKGSSTACAAASPIRTVRSSRDSLSLSISSANLKSPKSLPFSPTPASPLASPTRRRLPRYEEGPESCLTPVFDTKGVLSSITCLVHPPSLPAETAAAYLRFTEKVHSSALATSLGVSGDDEAFAFKGVSGTCEENTFTLFGTDTLGILFVASFDGESFSAAQSAACCETELSVEGLKCFLGTQEEVHLVGALARNRNEGPQVLFWGAKKAALPLVNELGAINVESCSSSNWVSSSCLVTHPSTRLYSDFASRLLTQICAADSRALQLSEDQLQRQVSTQSSRRAIPKSRPTTAPPQSILKRASSDGHSSVLSLGHESLFRGPDFYSIGCRGDYDLQKVQSFLDESRTFSALSGGIGEKSDGGYGVNHDRLITPRTLRADGETHEVPDLIVQMREMFDAAVKDEELTSSLVKTMRPVRRLNRRLDVTEGLMSVADCEAAEAQEDGHKSRREKSRAAKRQSRFRRSMFSAGRGRESVLTLLSNLEGSVPDRKPAGYNSRPSSAATSTTGSVLSKHPSTASASVLGTNRARSGIEKTPAAPTAAQAAPLSLAALSLKPSTPSRRNLHAMQSDSRKASPTQRGNRFEADTRPSTGVDPFQQKRFTSTVVIDDTAPVTYVAATPSHVPPPRESSAHLSLNASQERLGFRRSMSAAALNRRPMSAAAGGRFSGIWTHKSSLRTATDARLSEFLSETDKQDPHTTTERPLSRAQSVGRLSGNPSLGTFLRELAIQKNLSRGSAGMRGLGVPSSRTHTGSSHRVHSGVGSRGCTSCTVKPKERPKTAVVGRARELRLLRSHGTPFTLPGR